MKSKLKIYTSYVSPMTMNVFIEKQYLPIFIIRSIGSSKLIGKWSGTAVHFPEYAPSSDIFRAWRDGRMSLEDYHKRYIIEIAGSDFQGFISRLEYLANLSGARGIVLMGYGEDNVNCHRGVLATILNNSGLLEEDIKEAII